MSRWGTWAPVVSALAVAGLVVGVSVALRGGADGPPALRLAAGAGSTTDSAARAPSAGPRFTGTFPTGPQTAPVHDLPAGAAPVNRVRELAAALDVTAAPERVVGAWRAGPLLVRDEPGHPWTYGQGRDCGPDSSVSSDGTTTCVAPDPAPVTGSSGSGSAGSSPGSTATGSTATEPAVGCVQPQPSPLPEPDCPRDLPLIAPAPPIVCGSAVGKAGCTLPAPAMTEDEALAETERLRTALGLSTGEARAFTSYDGASVTVDPRVAGLRTRGIATTLELGADTRLRSASGWLADRRVGAEYPLVSAADALDRLAVPALGRPCDAATGCPELPALTDVELALVRTSLQDGEAALVPSWLFTGEGIEMTQLAVREDHVTEPTAPSEPEPTEPGAGSPPSDPGRTEPGGPRSPLAFDGAALVDGALSVRYGGVCVSGVSAEVKEGADTVTVSLTQDTPPPDQACIELYRPTFVPIGLAEPLGSRRVVDASSGRAVTVVTCPSQNEMCPE